jgi:hypothetical protein
VERTMIAPLSVERRRRLLKDLFACVGALTRTD